MQHEDNVAVTFITCSSLIPVCVHTPAHCPLSCLFFQSCSGKSEYYCLDEKQLWKRWVELRKELVLHVSHLGKGELLLLAAVSKSPAAARNKFDFYLFIFSCIFYCPEMYSRFEGIYACLTAGKCLVTNGCSLSWLSAWCLLIPGLRLFLR